MTCSNHSNHLEETISTLRFAQRTRAIKNQVKINIQNSPQQLQAMIDRLKFELRKALEEIKVLKIQIEGYSGEPTPIYNHNKYKAALEGAKIETIHEEEHSPDIYTFENTNIQFDERRNGININMGAKNINNKSKIDESVTIEEILGTVEELKREPMKNEIISFVSKEESNIGEEINEQGLLHNIPRHINIHTHCTYIYSLQCQYHKQHETRKANSQN